MKNLYFVMFAFLSLVGMTAKAAEVPVSGSIQAGVEYSITETGNSVDDYFTTSEVIESGKTVVVFYYNHSTDAIWGTSPIYFGPGGDNPLSSNKNLKDTAGNSVCKRVADKAKLLDAQGHAVIEIYQPKEEGATWTYVICTEAEAASLNVPEFGAGGNEGAGPIAPVSGSLVEKTEYAIPGTGNSFDEFYTCGETLSAGQTIVVFYYSHESGSLIKVPVYFGPLGKNPLSTTKTEVDAAGNKVARVIANASSLLNANNNPVVELYQPDNENATWCYVICSEDEAATIAIPEFGGSTPKPEPEKLPGQDVENAIVLTAGVDANFTSVEVAGKNVLYVKLVPANSGIVTMNIGAEANNKKWMEDGVMAYGSLKQNYFANGNQFNAEKGKTYYCLYNFADPTTSTISYTLQAVEEGAARGEAMLLEGNGTKTLLGIPHVDDDYFSKTTWYKLEKDGALDGNDLVVVAIAGDNGTEVALYVDEEIYPAKTYAMGEGSGMLPKNSTVKFDIDLAQHNYYIAISQDDVNGTATFTFKVAEAGETMAKAFTAVEGNNSVSKAGWYKYTHTGANKTLKLSGISKIYNENGGNVAEGDDVKVGFVIEEGTTVYFEANTSGFTLTLVDVEKGMTADDPVIIDNENGATFNMNSGVESDAYRYMKYTATEDGTFIYATQNAKILEFCNSATVRDITNPDAPKAVTTIQEETSEFGEPYFIYKWTVLAGHTYSIEQGLGNNFGTVEFYSMFTPAEAGETAGKALPIDLYEAVDLGRTTSTPMFYKFVAPEAGDYTISVQLVGYVKSYDANLNSTSIPKSYTDGLEYHNGTFTLAAGEALVFSCEPSQVIEHEGGGIDDSLIPNYYATVTKAEDAMGLDYTQPVAIALDDESTIDGANVWHGPITVPAGETLYVVANTTADVNAVYFAAPDQYGNLQWVNKSADLSVEIAGGKQIYALKSADADRDIQIMTYGMLCAGTFKASFTDPSIEPAEPLTLTINPDFAYNPETKALTISFTIPATYDFSNVPVENLNLVATTINNYTSKQSMEVSASTGEGAYSAGETFSITNTIDFDINVDDLLGIELETWGQDNVTIETGIVIYDEPIDDSAYYIVISKGEEKVSIKVSPDIKIEWKKGAELK